MLMYIPRVIFRGLDTKIASWAVIISTIIIAVLFLAATLGQIDSS